MILQVSSSSSFRSRWLTQPISPHNPLSDWRRGSPRLQFLRFHFDHGVRVIRLWSIPLYLISFRSRCPHLDTAPITSIPIAP